jgi:hypothetical protein
MKPHNLFTSIYLPQPVIPIHDTSRLYLWRLSDKILCDLQFFYQNYFYLHLSVDVDHFTYEQSNIPY